MEWHKLLGRAAVRIDPAKYKHLRGVPVLITGAGGSIGSALAAAVLNCGAEEVALLDSSEQALYRLTTEIASCKRAVPVLGSVLDEPLLEELFRRFQPAIVFHSAAFKHLPLMESQPFAAVENNTIGTYVLASAADRHRTSRLVAVSTDKAVNPTSVMGASKRLAELVVASFAQSRTTMTTVRLGNVLGSDGSVAPRFIEQIEGGGPVTITDAEATRYFFTMEETVNLVLLSSRGEAANATVIPDAAEPKSVFALAQFLMRELAAEQVEIKCTGLCAGEKLSEQLCYAHELQNAKQFSGYRVIPNRASQADNEGMIANLLLSIRERDFDLLMQTIRKYVPEYRASTQLQQLFGATAARSQV